MSQVQDHPITELVDADDFEALTAAVWRDGAPTDLAEPATRVILDRLPGLTGERRSRLLVLLGVLVGAEYPDTAGPVATAAADGVDDWLELLRGSAGDEPLTLALLFLLGHFPADKDRILAVVHGRELPDPDRTRIERALSTLDEDDPDLGRVWPSPSVWQLDEKEREFDRESVRRLTREQVRTNWANDSRTVHGYGGAKAYWAVRHGAPVSVPPTPPPAIAGPESPPGAGFVALRRHAGVLRCPDCHAGLEFRESDVRCTGCATAYPVADGILALGSGTRDDGPDSGGAASANLLKQLAEMPSMGVYYEDVLRPAFLRMAGNNWGGAVTPADEDDYIAEHLRPVDGPVLDLAAGAGRFTEAVTETVDADRVIALDMALPMLTVLRRRLPEVPAIQGSALDLPFTDASLGAVNCWNALQAFPDEAGDALREVGRCLRPGGTLTMMTFLWDRDPIYRHFQASHYFPGRPEGMLLFTAEQIRQWLADAGFTVRAESGTGTFQFITAERTRLPVGS